MLCSLLNGLSSISWAGAPCRSLRSRPTATADGCSKRRLTAAGAKAGAENEGSQSSTVNAVGFDALGRSEPTDRCLRGFALRTERPPLTDYALLRKGREAASGKKMQQGFFVSCCTFYSDCLISDLKVFGVLLRRSLSSTSYRGKPFRSLPVNPDNDSDNHRPE